MKKSEPIPLNSDRIQWKKLESEWLLLDIESGAYFILNGLSALVFNQVLAGSSYNEILEYMKEQDPEKASFHKLHLDYFLRNLEENNIIGSHFYGDKADENHPQFSPGYLKLETFDDVLQWSHGGAGGSA